MQNISQKSWPSFINLKASSLLGNQRETVEQIAGKLREATSVLLGTHQHPDGDALGSILALKLALEMHGKKVTAYIPDPPPDFFTFLPALETLTLTKPRVSDYDTVVLLDYTQLYRTNLEAEALIHPRAICIDHHYDNPRQVSINLIVPQAAATAHILFELFRVMNLPITKDIATCLLTGIFTDTGSFMHDSTTPEILEMASVLMHKGARLSHIAHETYQKKDLAGLRIWGRALSRILVNAKSGASVALVTYQDLQECHATLDDLSGVVNLLNTLPQTTFAMLLVEFEPGKIKGSLRSEPHKGIDVSKLARRLGGGGHKLASGFEVEGRLVQQHGMWRVLPASRPNSQ